MLEMTFSSLLVRKALHLLGPVYLLCLCIIIGDALLAFWHCDMNNQQQTVTGVMEAGLAIQDKYDNYEAGEDINLRMKIAISIGDIFIYHLGMSLLQELNFIIHIY